MNTTYENLFEKVDYLLISVEEIHKAIVNPKVIKPPPKTLSLEQTLIYLCENGFQVSKSKIYKLTSIKSIPFKKFGNKLVFDSRELDGWISSNLKENLNYTIDGIVKSASSKLNKKSKNGNKNRD